MAREERQERTPRPEREHPVGKALYALNREGFGVFYTRILATGAAPTPEMRQYEKTVLLAQVDRVRAMIDAL
jgi:hypothetical protein